MQVQSTIALIFDCDKTLSPEYMQAPILRKFGYDNDEKQREWWREKEELVIDYQRAGHKVNSEFGYLNLMLRCARDGRMRGLSNKVMHECGADLKLYPGLPDFFPRLKKRIEDRPEYREHNINVRYYIVSTGLAEVIRGSQLASCIDDIDIYACEFADGPDGTISEITHFLSPNEKTRPLFEISKGSSELVHAKMSVEQRSIPFENMVYIGDGPTDVPCFEVVNDHKGWSYAVYDPDVSKSLEAVFNLQKAGRTFCFGPADFREGSHTSIVLEKFVTDIADRILRDRRNALAAGVIRAGGHTDPYNVGK